MYYVVQGNNGWRNKQNDYQIRDNSTETDRYMRFFISTSICLLGNINFLISNAQLLA